MRGIIYKTKYVYNGSFSVKADYTYRPYVRDFCADCKYHNNLSLYGDGGSMFSPEVYEYVGYLCKYYGDKTLYTGSSEDRGYPFGCPVLEERKLEIQSLIEEDIERDKIYRRSKECYYHTDSNHCTKYNHECTQNVLNYSSCKSFCSKNNPPE